MPEQNPETVTDFAALSDADLTARYEHVRTRGSELAGQSEHSEEEAAEFSTLADELGPLQAEIQSRADRAAEAQARRDSFASLPEAAIPAVQPIQTPQAPAVEPTSVQKSTETAPVPSVSQMAVQTPAPPARTSNGIVTAHVLPHASGLVSKNSGEEFSGLTEISKAFIANKRTMGRRGEGRQSLVQFRRNRGEEFTIGDSASEDDSMRILRHARDESRLHGGSLAKQWQHNIDQGASLTAAAGWCAPSQNDYDLCRNWSAGVGLIDLPTVTVTRGGINYTDEPTFPEIYANAVAAGGGSNFLTEAQVIADTAKTCSEIPCPTFENRRLDVLALCIRVSFLQAAGYPEVVNAWTDGLLAAHEQEMNRIIIADMLTRAGAATVLPDPDTTAGQQQGFTAALLSGVELAAEDIRYQFMMSWTDTVEVILPHWILPQIRADLANRGGVDLLAVTDSQIAAMFSARNVRVQFVRGWQDGLVTGGALSATFPGGDAATPFLTALPTSVNFLAYPAGSVAVARQDVVTLTNVYDAASLAVNEFTSLFTEEGFAPVYPCPGQRLYTVTGCVTGNVGAANVDCIA